MPSRRDLLLTLAGHLQSSAAIIEALAEVPDASGLSPAPQPAPVVTPSEPIWNTLKRSQITIPSEVRVPAGQRDIYIPVTVDHTDRESFYCYVELLSLIHISEPTRPY